MKKREITKAMKDAWVQHLLSKFLLITFTDAAAAEMRTRLAGAFLTEGYEIDPEKIPTMTFNSFAMDLVKEFYNDLGFLKTPIVVDTNPTREAMGILPLITRDKVDGLNYNVAVESQYGALTIAIKVFKLIKSSRIDFSKPGATEEFANKFLRPANLYKYMSDQSIEQLVDLYQEYEQILTSQGLLTFADQEPMALSVLDMHPDQLAKFGFEHIVVDEFQDSSDIQMEFIKLFADCPTVKDIMVIGDDNQSIYGFRNANPDNMIHFQEKLGKPVTSLLMTQNYRSYEEIIDLANKLVALNVNRIDKPLVAAKGAGGTVSVRGFYNEPDEQKYIADNIKKLLEDGYKPEDIAIITFSKKELMKFAAAFSKEGIPWVMMAPVKVIENSRVLAAMSLADAFYEPEATQSYFNYLVAKYDGKILEELTDDEINKEIEELRSTFNPDARYSLSQIADICGFEPTKKQKKKVNKDMRNVEGLGQSRADKLRRLQASRKDWQGYHHQLCFIYYNTVKLYMDESEAAAALEEFNCSFADYGIDRTEIRGIIKSSKGNGAAYCFTNAYIINSLNLNEREAAEFKFETAESRELKKIETLKKKLARDKMVVHAILSCETYNEVVCLTGVALFRHHLYAVEFIR